MGKNGFQSEDEIIRAVINGNHIQIMAQAIDCHCSHPAEKMIIYQTRIINEPSSKNGDLAQEVFAECPTCGHQLVLGHKPFKPYGFFKKLAKSLGIGRRVEIRNTVTGELIKSFGPTNGGKEYESNR